MSAETPEPRPDPGLTRFDPGVIPGATRVLPPGSGAPVAPGCEASMDRTVKGGVPDEIPSPPGSHEFRPGDRLGRYRLVERVGSGGMGVVWRAWDPDLERPAAVKVLRMEDPELAARLLREARVAATLRHPHLVSVHDAGQQEGATWLVMDFVEGVPFSDWLAMALPSGEAAPPEAALRRAVTFLAQSAEAVAHAHAHGIIHRDLKPANILLTRSEPVMARVVDFGLAKELPRNSGDLSSAHSVPRLTVTGQAMGTPAYMSPEQARAESAGVGPATDVWSLGAMLYHLLTGRPPFERDTVWETIHATLLEEPLPPGRVRPGIPEALEAVCLRALEKDPTRRTATAEAIAADLRAWLAGASVQARPLRRFERVTRALRTHRILVAAVLAVFAIGTGLVLWTASGRAETVRRTHLLVESVAADVARFEDQVRRTDLPLEARESLAAQPLRVLELAVRDAPDFGPARSLRGVVLGLLGRTREADADLDAGCLLSPEDRRVWRLRGLRRLQTFSEAAPLPTAQWLYSRGVQMIPAAAPSPALRVCLDGGVSDLARMDTLPAPEPSDAAHVAFARALAALHSGRTDSAEEAQRILAGQPGARARFLLGFIRHGLGRFDEARVEYERALAEWPYDPALRRGHNRTLSMIGLLQDLHGTDARSILREALEGATWVTTRLPESAEAVHDRAVVKFNLSLAMRRSGEDARDLLVSCIEDCGEAWSGGVDRINVRLARGNAWHALGLAREERGEDPEPDWMRALADFEGVLQGEPAHTGGQINRAQVMLDLGKAEMRRGVDGRPRIREALTRLDRLVKDRPEFTSGYLARAVARMILGEADHAVGGDSRVEFEQALLDLDVVDRLEPGMSMTWVQRGNGHTRLGRLESAAGRDPRASYRASVEAFEEAVRLNPGYSEAMLGRGGALLSLALAEEARGQEAGLLLQRSLADLDESIRQHPANPVAWHNRGNVRRRLAQRESQAGRDPREAFAPALADLDAALQRGKTSAEGHEAKAHVQHDVGHALESRGMDARPWFEQSLASLAAAIAYSPPGAVEPLRLQAHVSVCLAISHFARGEDPRPFAGTALERLAALAALPRAAGSAHGDRGRLRLMLAHCHAARGHDPEPFLRDAEADLATAIELGHGVARLDQIWLYRWTGRWAQMTAACEAALQEHPPSAPEVRRRLEESRMFLQVEAHPLKSLALLTQAQLRLAVNHFEVARSLYEQGFRTWEREQAEHDPADWERWTRDPMVLGLLAAAYLGAARTESVRSTGRVAPLAEPGPIDEPTAAAARETAFRFLEAAAALGLRKDTLLRLQTDLEPLQSDPRWGALLERLR